MKTLRIKQLAFLFVLFLIACQEDSIIEEVEPIDEDMIAAEALADDYFNEIGGRVSDFKSSITVLRYQDGNIMFNTNTDTVSEYQVVNETTVTAYVEPGELIFWYRGSGLESVEDVDFDEESTTYLGEQPDEYFELIWVLQVPNTYDSAHQELKYDIVYESEDNQGIIIRLDPKIQVSTSVVGDSGSDGDGSNQGNEG